MAIKTITKTHNFSSTTEEDFSIDMGGKIYNGQATMALQGYDIGYQDDYDHNVRICKIRITNIKVLETKIDYTIIFELRDDGDHVGEGLVDIVAIADME
ncbi:MAG: hypothetical protein K2W92_01160 [Alphaproteobacteria bacterium]|nr:hypothetical protein [Alphaproteobacteria bacterium]